MKILLILKYNYLFIPNCHCHIMNIVHQNWYIMWQSQFEIERYLIFKINNIFITIYYSSWHDLNFYFQECPELKLSSHGRKVKKFGRPAPEIEGLVAATGLSHLIACSLELETGDLYLLLWRGGIRKLIVSIFR